MPPEDQDLQVTENPDGSVSVLDPTDHTADTDLDAGGNETGNENRPEGASGERESAEEAAADAAAAAEGETDAERQAIRERRRQERADRKAAQREREDNLRRELSVRDEQIAEMRQRLAQLDQRNVTADLAQLDSTIKRATDAVAYYKGIIQEATNKHDGAAVAEATERMILARSEAERLAGIKKNIVNTVQAQPQGLNPRVKALADAWISKNSWYKPDGSDDDSAVALSIDQRLIQDGFNPQTEAYWAELDRRVQKYLPHRASGREMGHNPGNQQRERPAGRTPVAGGGRESVPNGANRGSTFQLSAARVQALKDAGAWDDPKARADAIRRFREYDRTHNGSR